jgi:hypothetical protein
VRHLELYQFLGRTAVLLDEADDYLTWLATGVAPVGHFTEGTLRTAMIDAPLWVLVSISARFDVCATVHAVSNAVLAAGLPFATLALDLPQDNLTRYVPLGPVGCQNSATSVALVF